MDVRSFEVLFDLILTHGLECFHRIGILGCMVFGWMSSLVLLFGLKSLGSLRFGDRFFSFGVVVPEAVPSVEANFALMLVGDCSLILEFYVSCMRYMGFSLVAFQAVLHQHIVSVFPITDECCYHV